MSDALAKVLFLPCIVPISFCYLQGLLAEGSGYYDGKRFWEDRFSQGVLCGVVALLLIVLILRALHRMLGKIGEKCQELHCPPRAR